MRKWQKSENGMLHWHKAQKNNSAMYCLQVHATETKVKFRICKEMRYRKEHIRSVTKLMVPSLRLRDRN